MQLHLLKSLTCRSIFTLLRSPNASPIAATPLLRPFDRSSHLYPPWSGHRNGTGGSPVGLRQEHAVGRDWLARQWAEDKRAAETAKRDSRRAPERLLGGWDPFGKLKGGILGARLWSEGVIEREHSEGLECGSDLSPTSPEETKIAPLLARSDLVITRDIEWANLMFAFEQESRYNIVDPHQPHAPVGSIHESSNVIYRQLLRTRRPFVAYVFDPYGNEMFRVRRPFWWINSTIYVEVDGKEIGVVHRRWHLWKRIYDLYLGYRQFAVVENPGFWNWTFTLKNEEEKVLAEINRDWRGFGFELFTDAGQYVIRFGAGSVGTFSDTADIQELEIERPLNLSERAIAVSLAVSLDCDYFSRHGGWGMPLFISGE